MRLRCCLGVAYFLAKSEPVLLIKVLLIKKACTHSIKYRHLMLLGIRINRYQNLYQKYILVINMAGRKLI